MFCLEMKSETGIIDDHRKQLINLQLQAVTVKFLQLSQASCLQARLKLDQNQREPSALNAIAQSTQEHRVIRLCKLMLLQLCCFRKFFFFNISTSFDGNNFQCLLLHSLLLFVLQKRSSLLPWLQSILGDIQTLKPSTIAQSFITLIAHLKRD